MGVASQNGHKATKAKLPVDSGDEIERRMRRFYPLLTETAFGDASDVLGLEVAFDLSNPAIKRVIDRLAQKVRDVADTTRAEIQDLVDQATEEGWPNSKLAAAIDELADIRAPDRARSIARTESAAAYSQGSLVAYGESGVVAGTEWLVADPCPICEPLDGKVVDLGEDFDDGIDAPPAHPNCRCAIAPVLKE